MLASTQERANEVLVSEMMLTEFHCCSQTLCAMPDLVHSQMLVWRCIQMQAADKNAGFVDANTQ